MVVDHVATSFGVPSACLNGIRLEGIQMSHLLTLNCDEGYQVFLLVVFVGISGVLRSHVRNVDPLSSDDFFEGSLDDPLILGCDLRTCDRIREEVEYLFVGWAHDLGDEFIPQGMFL